jgi:endoribonuclease LACTB2
VSSIVAAASVLLVQEDDVLLVRRSERLRFFGGFWAFPGGKISSADADAATRFPSWGADAALIGAARELFEETGILAARGPDGAFPQAGCRADDRRELLASRQSFTVLLERQGLHLDPSDFAFLGQITTPEFAPVRYATTFFAVRMPGGQAVEIWPGELTESIWSSPDESLDRWRRGELLLSPPTAMSLRALSGAALEQAPARLRPLLASLGQGAMHPIEFAPGVRMVPLRSQALAATTHTNAFLVGSGQRYLIDPGCDDPVEQAKLFTVLDEPSIAGSLVGILLTHQHPDHVAAALACARRYNVPIGAHRATADLLTGKVAVDFFIDEGTALHLGERPDGKGPWQLQALFTPGHAPGHLALLDSCYGCLFAGDMVSTATSVLIAPPRGDLTAYFESLRRLAQVPARLLLPGHGNPSSRPAAVFEEALAHRQERERQLLEVLTAGPTTVDELAPILYRGLPAPAMKFARLQIEAGLEKLQREGRARQTGHLWQAHRT